MYCYVREMYEAIQASNNPRKLGEQLDHRLAVNQTYTHTDVCRIDCIVFQNLLGLSNVYNSIKYTFLIKPLPFLYGQNYMKHKKIRLSIICLQRTH